MDKSQKSDFFQRKRLYMPEVIFGIPLLLSFILQYIFPLPFYTLMRPESLYGFGLIFMIIGAGLVIAARKAIKRAHASDLEIKEQPPKKLVTTSVFRLTRNPISLGIVLFMTGGSAVFNLPWLIILLIPAIIVTDRRVIVSEEQDLEQIFGEDFLAYKQETRRWI